jgi:DNA-binding NtrC family response regulator
MAVNGEATRDTTRGTVVLVDDEEQMCRAVTKYLTMEKYEVAAFSRPGDAVDHIRRNPPDVVVTDMMMPELSGMDVLRAARDADESTSVVVMTGYGTIEGAIEAMRAGAFDYVTKPVNMSALLGTIGKAVERRRQIEESESLTETLMRRAGGEGRIIGESPQMRELMALVAKVAPTDTPVLIRGESGTGKELIANALHQSSPRRKRRFVAINCASIPETLLESELFGHEKGAFTGADKTKPGLIELADGGTLFLDEIGELPLSLQAKLLRALQEREIQRVGAVRAIPVDFRLVAATNRDLQAAMSAREFRQDLYFRLNVITLDLPPLRAREGDLTLLVEHFLERARRALRRPALSISPEALAALGRHGYPGNIRELQNVMERMTVLCDGDRIELKDVPAEIRGNAAGGAARDAERAAVEYKDAKDRFERDYLVRMVDAAKGNISEAARLSGISRRHFYEKMEKLGIRMDK